MRRPYFLVPLHSLCLTRDQCPVQLFLPIPQPQQRFHHPINRHHSTLLLLDQFTSTPRLSLATTHIRRDPQQMVKLALLQPRLDLCDACSLTQPPCICLRVRSPHPLQMTGVSSQQQHLSCCRHPPPLRLQCVPHRNKRLQLWLTFALPSFSISHLHHFSRYYRAALRGTVKPVTFSGERICWQAHTMWLRFAIQLAPVQFQTLHPEFQQLLPLAPLHPFSYCVQELFIVAEDRKNLATTLHLTTIEFFNVRTSLYKRIQLCFQPIHGSRYDRQSLVHCIAAKLQGVSQILRVCVTQSPLNDGLTQLHGLFLQLFWSFRG